MTRIARSSQTTPPRVARFALGLVLLTVILILPL
jgi:hypothetical protein